MTNKQDTRLMARFLYLLTNGSSMSRGKRRALYAGIAIALLSLIWIPVGVFLAVNTTTYTSRIDIILPGSGIGHAVSLDSLGQTSATTTSPYNSNSVDPRVNYKAIIESEPVLSAAAAKLEMTLKEFGKPRIKLVEQTALIHLSIQATTADLANCKAKALYHSFQAELERLRSDEVEQREAAINQLLKSYDEKLRLSQQNIINYQSRSSIISLEQFSELMMNLERARVSLRELKAERANIRGNIENLQQSLGATVKQAAALHTLQQDALFQELAVQWAESISQLSKASSMWADRHPEVVLARYTHDDLRKILLLRAARVVPDNRINTEKLITLSSSNPTLFTRLVDLTVTLNGLTEQVANLEDSMAVQQAFLDESTTDASNLEDLKRKHQVATAVMTTALAKLDIGKSDHFSSYPLLQILAQPTLPEKPDTLSRNMALLGAVFGSFMTLFGLLLLWVRKPFFQKLQKNA